MLLRLIYRLLMAIPITLSILLITLFLFYQLPGVHVLDSSQIQLGTDHERLLLLWEQEERNPFDRVDGLFYFGVHAGYVPDSIALVPMSFRPSLRELSKEVRNPRVMNRYAVWIREEIKELRDGNTSILSTGQFIQMLQSTTVQRIREKLVAWGIDRKAYPGEWNEILSSTPANNLPVLEFSWNGNENLFHYYLTAIVTGDPSIHTLTGESVRSKFLRTLRWTLAYSIPVLLAGWAFVFFFVLWFYDRTIMLTRIDRGIVFLYAFPTFVLATLALVFFTSHRYGMISYLFPFPVFWESKVGSLWDIYRAYGGRLILPMLLFSISPVILFYRVFYEKLRQIRSLQPSFRYLPHLGLSNSHFRIKYLSRYLFVSTWAILSNLFVAVLGGSLIIEWIFNIPGLGRFLYESIVNYDVTSTVYLVFVFSIVQQFGHVLSDFMIEYFSIPEQSNGGLL